MLHRIPIDKLGPRGATMGHAVETCIHCGFCLPTCPTYEVLGDEADSPRGRIMLMKEVLEGKLEASQAAPHIDRCLGCVACQTHCPCGVDYGHLLSSYRSLESSRAHSPASFAIRLRRKLASWTLPYPRRFSLAMRMGRLGKKLSFVTPAALQPMLDLVPEKLPDREPLPAYFEAVGNPRGSVMLHIGCAAQVLRPDISAAAIRVLTRNGISVQVPPSQGCCGALSWHIGDAETATRMAVHNFAAFGDGDEPIITTAAGCGSGMHEYPLILAGRDNAAQAERFAERVVDISVYLDRIGIEPPPAGRPLRVAYHDACHLAHAQKVRKPPRNLLQSISGIELVDLQESDLCCGSAGTYNIDQPVIAAQLGQRKAENLIATSCDVVVLGNIGCQVQIEQHLAKAGSTIPVLHTIQLLDRAYRNDWEWLAAS
ncbi:MAG: (Fe-S)-binding protein [Planctomycetaceae bacterium]